MKQIIEKARLLFAFILFSSITHAQLWESVGDGIKGPGAYVSAMAIYNGALYVAGHFDTAGGKPANNIAKWDGNKWSTVGSGLSGKQVEVNAMTVYKNELYVGGDFEKADGKEAYCIAKWDGANWSDIDTDWVFLKVNALTVYKDILYIAGESLNSGKTLIESWDGTSLKNTGIDENYSVNTMCIYKDELYTAGNYADTNFTYGNKIPRWNGQHWAYDWIGKNKVYGKIKALLAYNGTLYAGGFCGIPVHDTMYTQNIVVNDSANWKSMGNGLVAKNSSCRRIERRNIIYTLAAYNGSIYAGGDFNISGGDTIYCVARWNGKKWMLLDKGLTSDSFDLPGLVCSMVEYKGWLYVGGDFSSAGDKKVNNIAQWHTQKSN